MRRVVLAFSIGVLVSLFGLSPAHAQEATLLGTVTDASGAVVPGATVTVVNMETNVSTKAVPNDVGQYVAPNLPPGRYEIRAEATGFKKKTVTNIVLLVAQKARVDISIEVGAVTESVEVTGQAPVLENGTAELGQVIDQQQVAQLPLNGRDFMQLALLTAGVNQGRASGWTGVRLFSANGLMGDFNNYLMDGVNNREGATNSLVESPSVDAIREFKAETGLFSAEHQAAGLSVVVATKSGTNSLHGSAFEYLRNDKLDASGFFPTSNRTKPSLRRNQFGFSLGGPVVRDKHFWFVNYEGERERRASVQIGRIPTPDQLSGIFTVPIRDPRSGVNFPNNQVPASRIDPVLKAILGYYPQPNRSDPNANYVNQTPQSVNDDRFLVRTDHHLSSNDHVFVRFSYRDDTSFTPGLIPGLSGGHHVNDTRGAVVGYEKIFRPTLLNEVRLGYTRWVFNDEAEARGTPFAKNLGVLGIELPVGATNEITLPNSLSIATYDGIGTGQTVLQIMNNYEIGDTLTWIKGRHTLKFGGSVPRAQFKSFALGTRQNGSGTYTGQFSGHPVADALMDAPATVTKAGFSPITYPRQTKFGAFVQDDWRATSRLTLNLGVRYDLDLPVNDRVLAAFEPSFGGLVFPSFVIERSGFDVQSFYQTQRPDIPIRIENGKSVYDADTNNFSPRAGFAYSLGGKQKTVVRGGAGIFFNTPSALGIRCSTTLPPFTNRFQATSDPTTPTISLVSTGAAGVAASRLPIRTWTFPGNRKFLNGYVEMWALNIQREVAPDLMVEVGYTGNHGVKNISTLDINQVRVPGPGAVDSRRPYQGFGPIMVLGNYQFSTYNGMTVRAVKRMGHGLSFLLGYTTGKALSNADEFIDGRQQDINCLRCEKALAYFNLAHRFTMSYAYELPVGKGRAGFSNRPSWIGPFIDRWELGGIVTLQSGFPFSPSVSGVIGSNTGRSTRPNRTGNGNLPTDQRRREHFWDQSAFARPLDFTFGNAGRNILYGPGLATWDFSLRKEFPLRFWSEQAGLGFRAEMFNILNRTNFGAPVTDIASPTFGQIFSTATTPREIQFALRLYW